MRLQHKQPHRKEVSHLKGPVKQAITRSALLSPSREPPALSLGHCVSQEGARVAARSLTNPSEGLNS